MVNGQQTLGHPRKSPQTIYCERCLGENERESVIKYTSPILGTNRIWTRQMSNTQLSSSQSRIENYALWESQFGPWGPGIDNAHGCILLAFTDISTWQYYNTLPTGNRMGTTHNCVRILCPEGNYVDFVSFFFFFFFFWGGGGFGKFLKTDIFYKKKSVCLY